VAIATEHRLSLTEEEREIVRRILASAFDEVRQEIRHTHEADLKEQLRHQEHVLRAVLEKV
jgi:hypothetical protein